MKLEVIDEKCIGCGICINMAPEVFAYGDDGKSKVIKQEINDDIKNIIDMCPTGAIVISEEDPTKESE